LHAADAHLDMEQVQRASLLWQGSMKNVLKGGQTWPLPGEKADGKQDG